MCYGNKSLKFGRILYIAITYLPMCDHWAVLVVHLLLLKSSMHTLVQTHSLSHIQTDTDAFNLVLPEGGYVASK